MSEAKQSELGDIVKLKSGGPDMTVQAITDGGNYRCQWFAGKKLEHGFFPGESLVSVASS